MWTHPKNNDDAINYITRMSLFAVQMSMNVSHQMTACTSVITRREALTVLVMSFSR